MTIGAGCVRDTRVAAIIRIVDEMMIDHRCVAFVAGNLPVLPRQRVSRASVLESGSRLPTLHAVTGQALALELAAMLIPVAGQTLGGKSQMSALKIDLLGG